MNTSGATSITCTVTATVVNAGAYEAEYGDPMGDEARFAEDTLMGLLQSLPEHLRPILRLEVNGKPVTY